MTTAQKDTASSATYPKPAYAWYVVVLLMFFYVLSFAASGYIFGVAQDITAALGWNDVIFIGGSAAWCSYLPVFRDLQLELEQSTVR